MLDGGLHDHAARVTEQPEGVQNVHGGSKAKWMTIGRPEGKCVIAKINEAVFPSNVGWFLCSLSHLDIFSGIVAAGNTVKQLGRHHVGHYSHLTSTVSQIHNSSVLFGSSTS